MDPDQESSSSNSDDENDDTVQLVECKLTSQNVSMQPIIVQVEHIIRGKSKTMSLERPQFGATFMSSTKKTKNHLEQATLQTENQNGRKVVNGGILEMNSSATSIGSKNNKVQSLEPKNTFDYQEDDPRLQSGSDKWSFCRPLSLFSNSHQCYLEKTSEDEDDKRDRDPYYVWPTDSKEGDSDEYQVTCCGWRKTKKTAHQKQLQEEECEQLGSIDTGNTYECYGDGVIEMDKSSDDSGWPPDTSEMRQYEDCFCIKHENTNDKDNWLSSCNARPNQNMAFGEDMDGTCYCHRPYTEVPMPEFESEEEKDCRDSLRIESVTAFPEVCSQKNICPCESQSLLVLKETPPTASKIPSTSTSLENMPTPLQKKLSSPCCSFIEEENENESSYLENVCQNFSSDYPSTPNEPNLIDEGQVKYQPSQQTAKVVECDVVKECPASVTSFLSSSSRSSRIKASSAVSSPISSEQLMKPEMAYQKKYSIYSPKQQKKSDKSSAEGESSFINQAYNSPEESLEVTPSMSVSVCKETTVSICPSMVQTCVNNEVPQCNSNDIVSICELETSETLEEVQQNSSQSLSTAAIAEASECENSFLPSFNNSAEFDISKLEFNSLTKVDEVAEVAQVHEADESDSFLNYFLTKIEPPASESLTDESSIVSDKSSDKSHIKMTKFLTHEIDKPTTLICQQHDKLLVCEEAEENYSKLKNFKRKFGDSMLPKVKFHECPETNSYINESKLMDLYQNALHNGEDCSTMYPQCCDYQLPTNCYNVYATSNCRQKSPKPSRKQNLHNIVAINPAHCCDYRQVKSPIEESRISCQVKSPIEQSRISCQVKSPVEQNRIFCQVKSPIQQTLISCQEITHEQKSCQTPSVEVIASFNKDNGRSIKSPTMPSKESSCCSSRHYYEEPNKDNEQEIRSCLMPSKESSRCSSRQCYEEPNKDNERQLQSPIMPSIKESSHCLGGQGCQSQTSLESISQRSETKSPSQISKNKLSVSLNRKNFQNYNMGVRNQKASTSPIQSMESSCFLSRQEPVVHCPITIQESDHTNSESKSPNSRLSSLSLSAISQESIINGDSRHAKQFATIELLGSKYSPSQHCTYDSNHKHSETKLSSQNSRSQVCSSPDTEIFQDSLCNRYVGDQRKLSPKLQSMESSCCPSRNCCQETQLLYPMSDHESQHSCTETKPSSQKSNCRTPTLAQKESFQESTPKVDVRNATKQSLIARPMGSKYSQSQTSSHQSNYKHSVTNSSQISKNRSSISPDRDIYQDSLCNRDVKERRKFTSPVQSMDSNCYLIPEHCPDSGLLYPIPDNESKHSQIQSMNSSCCLIQGCCEEPTLCYLTSDHESQHSHPETRSPSQISNFRTPTLPQKEIFQESTPDDDISHSTKQYPITRSMGSKSSQSQPSSFESNSQHSVTNSPKIPKNSSSISPGKDNYQDSLYSRDIKERRNVTSPVQSMDPNCYLVPEQCPDPALLYKTSDNESKQSQIQSMNSSCCLIQGCCEEPTMCYLTSDHESQHSHPETRPPSQISNFRTPTLPQKEIFQESTPDDDISHSTKQSLTEHSMGSQNSPSEPSIFESNYKHSISNSSQIPKNRFSICSDRDNYQGALYGRDIREHRNVTSPVQSVDPNCYLVPEQCPDPALLRQTSDNESKHSQVHSMSSSCCLIQGCCEEPVLMYPTSDYELQHSHAETNLPSQMSNLPQKENLQEPTPNSDIRYVTKPSIILKSKGSKHSLLQQPTHDTNCISREIKSPSQIDSTSIYSQNCHLPFPNKCVTNPTKPSLRMQSMESKCSPSQQHCKGTTSPLTKNISNHTSSQILSLSPTHTNTINTKQDYHEVINPTNELNSKRTTPTRCYSHWSNECEHLRDEEKILSSHSTGVDEVSRKSFQIPTSSLQHTPLQPHINNLESNYRQPTSINESTSRLSPGQIIQNQQLPKFASKQQNFHSLSVSSAVDNKRNRSPNVIYFRTTPDHNYNLPMDRIHELSEVDHDNNLSTGSYKSVNSTLNGMKTSLSPSFVGDRSYYRKEDNSDVDFSVGNLMSGMSSNGERSSAGSQPVSRQNSPNTTCVYKNDSSLPVSRQNSPKSHDQAHLRQNFPNTTCVYKNDSSLPVSRQNSPKSHDQAHLRQNFPNTTHVYKNNNLLSVSQQNLPVMQDQTHLRQNFPNTTSVYKNDNLLSVSQQNLSMMQDQTQLKQNFSNAESICKNDDMLSVSQQNSFKVLEQMHSKLNSPNFSANCKNELPTYLQDSPLVPVQACSPSGSFIGSCQSTEKLVFCKPQILVRCGSAKKREKTIDKTDDYFGNRFLPEVRPMYQTRATQTEEIDDTSYILQSHYSLLKGTPKTKTVATDTMDMDVSFNMNMMKWPTAWLMPCQCPYRRKCSHWSTEDYQTTESSPRTSSMKNLKKINENKNCDISTKAKKSSSKRFAKKVNIPRYTSDTQAQCPRVQTKLHTSCTPAAKRRQQSPCHSESSYDCKPSSYDCKPSSYDCKTSGYDCKPSGYDCKSSNYDCKPSNYDCKPSNYDCKPSNYDCKPSSYDCKSSSYDCKSSNYDCKPSNYDCKSSSYDCKPSNKYYKYCSSDKSESMSSTSSRIPFTPLPENAPNCWFCLPPISPFYRMAYLPMTCPFYPFTDGTAPQIINPYEWCPKSQMEYCCSLYGDDNYDDETISSLDSGSYEYDNSPHRNENCSLKDCNCNSCTNHAFRHCRNKEQFHRCSLSVSDGRQSPIRSQNPQTDISDADSGCVTPTPFDCCFSPDTVTVCPSQRYTSPQVRQKLHKRRKDNSNANFTQQQEKISCNYSPSSLDDDINEELFIQEKKTLNGVCSVEGNLNLPTAGADVLNLPTAGADNLQGPLISPAGSKHDCLSPLSAHGVATSHSLPQDKSKTLPNFNSRKVKNTYACVTESSTPPPSWRSTAENGDFLHPNSSVSEPLISGVQLMAEINGWTANISRCLGNHINTRDRATIRSKPNLEFPKNEKKMMSQCRSAPQTPTSPVNFNSDVSQTSNLHYTCSVIGLPTNSVSKGDPLVFTCDSEPSTEPCRISPKSQKIRQSSPRSCYCTPVISPTQMSCSSPRPETLDICQSKIQSPAHLSPANTVESPVESNGKVISATFQSPCKFE